MSALGKLDIVEIIDWYDGVVVAIVRPSWRSGIYLASLLRWSQEKRHRVYALLPLLPEQVASVTAWPEGEWEPLLAFLRELAGAVTGSVGVVVVEEARDVVVHETAVSVESIREHLIGDIDLAMTAEAAVWDKLIAAQGGASK
jgi:hypothetical protein